MSFTILIEGVIVILMMLSSVGVVPAQSGKDNIFMQANHSTTLGQLINLYAATLHGGPGRNVIIRYEFELTLYEI